MYGLMHDKHQEYAQNDHRYNHHGLQYDYVPQPIKTDPDLEIVDHDMNEILDPMTNSSNSNSSNNSLDLTITHSTECETSATDSMNDNDRSILGSDMEEALLIVVHSEDDEEEKEINKKKLLKKKYKCAYCSELFTTINLRKQHEASGHTGAKLLKCGYCDMYFPSKYRKKVHEIRHSSDCPYLCSFCGIGFKSLYKRKVHEGAHSGQRPYLCQYCGEKFPSQYRKNIHETEHISKTPYECRYCDETFPTQYRCKQHELRHSSDKPYQCPFCHDSFKSAHKRDSHVLSHSGLSNPYQCPHCPEQSFRTPYKLRTHLATAHRLQPSEMRDLIQIPSPRDAFVLASTSGATVQSDKGACNPSPELDYLKRMPVDEIVTCFSCSAQFSNKLGLISHIRKHHTFTFL